MEESVNHIILPPSSRQNNRISRFSWSKAITIKSVEGSKHLILDIRAATIFIYRASSVLSTALHSSDQWSTFMSSRRKVRLQRIVVFQPYGLYKKSKRMEISEGLKIVTSWLEHLFGSGMIDTIYYNPDSVSADYSLRGS